MYEATKWREMHLRGQDEDEKLEHHPQFPGRFSEESTQNSEEKWLNGILLWPSSTGSRNSAISSHTPTSFLPQCRTASRKTITRLETGKYF